MGKKYQLRKRWFILNKHDKEFIYIYILIIFLFGYTTNIREVQYITASLTKIHKTNILCVGLIIIANKLNSLEF